MKAESIAESIRKYETEMLTAERFLWKNPELGFREWKSQEYLAARFREMGLEVREAGDIPGFYADIETGKPGPMLCILGEMDALPVPDHPECDKQTGAAHACGHNCQAAALIGIAGALSEKRTLDGLCGKIRVMAVPAEELVDMDYRSELRAKGTIKYLDGKTELLRRGFFDGVDACFYLHTWGGGKEKPIFYMNEGTSGIILKRVLYTGGTAGDRPNALYAATTAISAVNALREKYSGTLFYTHTIVTKGGQAVNVVPTEVVLENDVRADSYPALTAANDKIDRAFAAGALAVGAQVKLIGLDTYLPHCGCEKLDDLFVSVAARHCELLRERGRGGGGSDFGNLSAIMPTTFGYIDGSEGAGHGAEYFIRHPEWAVVESARVQAEFAVELLSDGARAYREAVKDYKPLFPSARALMDALDKINAEHTCVEYGDGEASVRWVNR